MTTIKDAIIDDDMLKRANTPHKCTNCKDKKEVKVRVHNTDKIVRCPLCSGPPHNGVPTGKDKLAAVVGLIKNLNQRHKLTYRISLFGDGSGFLTCDAREKVYSFKDEEELMELCYKQSILY